MYTSNGIKDILHRIRVKLYPGNLPGAGGTYIAKTSNEAVLSIEQVCSALKNRGGFNGNYDDLVSHVRQFFDEMAYQLCDGFSVNTGYFSVHPHIGGVFKALDESYDPVKHPIGFQFRVRAKLRRLIRFISVNITGLADTAGFIDRFTDVSTGAVNEKVSPGGAFVITGDRIRVLGESEACGVYFQPLETPDEMIKAPGCLAVSARKKLVGMTPALTAGKRYRLVVVTQYNGSSNSFLKKPKKVISRFEVTAVDPAPS